MIKAENPLRVVVCGTTFGRVYLRGIEQLPGEFELVGILARGSEQAVKCAQCHNVPLYTDVEQLATSGVDMACVVVRSTVVGGQGTELANDLLTKGIHVMQEHPVHHDDLVKCLRSARKSSCHYRINSFYPDIEPVRRFIITARQALHKSKAVYVDAACSIHVLFPLVDILGQSFGGFRPWHFGFLSDKSSSDPFFSLDGQINGVPITLRIQNQMNPADPDNHTHLLHRVVIGTNNGSLMLTDSHGLVLWSPRMHVARRQDGVLDLYGCDPFLNLPVTELVTTPQERSFKSIFDGLWPESIKRSLCRFRHSILSCKDDKRLSQYQLTACRVWQDIGQQLGSPQIVACPAPNPLGLSALKSGAIEK